MQVGAGGASEYKLFSQVRQRGWYLISSRNTPGQPIKHDIYGPWDSLFRINIQVIKWHIEVPQNGFQNCDTVVPKWQQSGSVTMWCSDICSDT